MGLRALLLLLASAPAAFGADAASLECGGQELVVRKVTNYSPRAGGVNGRCGPSASGVNVCDHSVELFLTGRSSFVMAAVPQRGGTSSLFGGVYKAALRGFGDIRLVIYAGDRYGAGSNGMSKMDVVTDQPRGFNPDRLNNSPNARLLPCGRIDSLPAPQRTVSRHAGAQAKLRPFRRARHR